MKYKVSQFNIIIKNMDNAVYFYNTFSKALSLIPKDVITNLKNNELNKIDVSIQEELFQNGYLVNIKDNEIEQLENAYRYIHNQSDYISIVLIPTFACNFSCPYCFEGKKPQLNKDEIQTFFQTLILFSKKEFHSKKHIHISLFGGEPLLVYDYFKNYFLFLNNLSKEYGFQYSSSLTTNGYLLFEKRIIEMFSLFHLENIQITLDGNERSHNETRCLQNGTGTFKDIIKNFKDLLHICSTSKLKCNIKLRINLLNNTLDDIDEITNLFSENEKTFFSVYFRPVYNTKCFNVNNKNKIDLKLFYQLAKEKNFRFSFGEAVRFCHCEGDGGLEQFFVVPDCTVWKCINDSEQKEGKIGYINEEGDLLIEQDYLSHWTDNSPFNDSVCRTCKWLPVCWGGCPLQYAKSKRHICMYEKTYNLFELILCR